MSDPGRESIRLSHAPHPQRCWFPAACCRAQRPDPRPVAAGWWQAGCGTAGRVRAVGCRVGGGGASGGDTGSHRRGGIEKPRPRRAGQPVAGNPSPAFRGGSPAHKGQRSGPASREGSHHARVRRRIRTQPRMRGARPKTWQPRDAVTLSAEGAILAGAGSGTERRAGHSSRIRRGRYTSRAMTPFRSNWPSW